MKVHAVEDDAGLNDPLMILINHLGHEVVSYRDAEKFLESTPPAPRDVVLIDLHLPGVYGGHAIRHFQQLKNPPRIVPISGQSASSVRAATVRLSCSRACSFSSPMRWRQRVSVRRIKIAMASGCPAAQEWGDAAIRLAAARASPA